MENNVQFDMPTDPQSDSTSAAGTLKADRRQNRERRAYPRYQLTTTAEVVEVQTGARALARSSDLSYGGCYVDSTTPVAVGKHVQLRLSLGKQTFEALAEVATSQPNMGMGLRFIQIAPDQRSVLEEWIHRLSDGLRPGAESAHQENASPAQRVPFNEQSEILQELIRILIIRGILSDEKGADMLRRLRQEQR